MEVVGSTRRGKYCGTSDLYSGGLPMVPVVPSEYTSSIPALDSTQRTIGSPPHCVATRRTLWQHVWSQDQKRTEKSVAWIRELNIAWRLCAGVWMLWLLENEDIVCAELPGKQNR